MQSCSAPGIGNVALSECTSRGIAGTESRSCACNWVITRREGAGGLGYFVIDSTNGIQGSPTQRTMRLNSGYRIAPEFSAPYVPGPGTGPANVSVNWQVSNGMSFYGRAVGSIGPGSLWANHFSNPTPPASACTANGLEFWSGYSGNSNTGNSRGAYLGESIGYCSCN